MSWTGLWVLGIAGAWACCAMGCAAPGGAAGGGGPLETVRARLARADADSDTAVILTRAMEEARALADEPRDGALAKALDRADEAEAFSPSLEAPLPEGWPRPSLPGLIRIKTYPPVRAAWADGAGGSNGQFMTLFRHIKARNVPMTAPVLMQAEAGGPEGSEPRPARTMAFLYRRTTQDAAGRFGDVRVADEQPVRVASIGLKGPYWESRFQAAEEKLRQWTRDSGQWRPAGSRRVLAYHSPFVPFWSKYSEVQLPVEPLPAGNDAPKDNQSGDDDR
ncbi:MAG TPA: heme-binding protein [Phycisphaerae bacterium]|nr:heme-binding protein [Phycisphaerae bacterium]